MRKPGNARNGKNLSGDGHPNINYATVVMAVVIIAVIQTQTRAKKYKRLLKMIQFVK